MALPGIASVRFSWCPLHDIPRELIDRRKKSREAPARGGRNASALARNGDDPTNACHAYFGSFVRACVRAVAAAGADLDKGSGSVLSSLPEHGHGHEHEHEHEHAQDDGCQC